MLTSFNAALSVTSSYISLPRPFMACPTLYIHLGTSRPFRTATTRRIYKNTVKDKVRMAIIKNPRLERKKFIILTSTLTTYPVIQDITKPPIASFTSKTTASVWMNFTKYAKTMESIWVRRWRDSFHLYSSL